MDAREVSRLGEAQLMMRLREATQRGRTTLVELLVLLGEVDARRSHRAEGYSCLYHFCRGALHMGDGEAFRRIRVAKVARRHPAVLSMIASGALHLTAVVILSRHLRRSNVQELLEAAAHKSKAELLVMLAQRFPQPDVAQFCRPAAPSIALPYAPPTETRMPAVATSGTTDPHTEARDVARSAAAPTECSSVRRVESAPLTPETFPDESMTTSLTPEVAPQRVTPRAPERFALQAMLDDSAHADLVALQALLSHAIPSSDLGAVLGRALTIARRVLERQRHRDTSMPHRSPRRTTTDPAHIPARVRRQVWQRDGQRCTFVGRHGHRCTETHLLELDHVLPVARGGRGTVDNLRVRCRAHNQLEAERVFGVAFMHAQREHAHAARTRSA